jgi:DNA-binding response OmpR family regulator
MPQPVVGDPRERPRATDVLLVDAEWPSRALLRAQLIDEGFEVLATEAWPMARRLLLTGVTPRLAIVNLLGLPDSDLALKELTALVDPGRVLLVTGAGAALPDETRRLPVHVLARPVAIGSIVATAARLMQKSPPLANPC